MRYEKTKRTNKAVIILTLALVLIVGFVTVWFSLNYGAIKSSLNGTKLYTQEEVTEAYNQGLTDRTAYETQINEWISMYETLETRFSTQKQELELKKAEIIELATENQINSETIIELTTNLNDIEDELNSYISDIDKIYNLLTRDVEPTVLENAKIIAIYNKLIEINNETIATIEILNNTIQNNELTIETLNNTVAEKSTLLSQYILQTSTLKNQLNSLAVDLANDKYKYAILENELLQMAINDYENNNNQMVTNITNNGLEFVTYTIENNSLLVNVISNNESKLYCLEVKINNNEIYNFENMYGNMTKDIDISNKTIYKLEITANAYGDLVTCNIIFGQSNNNGGMLVLVDSDSYGFTNGVTKDNIRIGQTVTFKSSNFIRVKCNNKDIEVVQAGDIHIAKFKVAGDIEIKFF